MDAGKIKNLIRIITIPDVILIVLLLLSSVFFLLKRNNISSILVIKVNNQVFGKFELDTDQRIVVKEGFIVEIKGHKYHVLKSDCKGQFCVHQGWVTSSPILCVPNKISLTVLSKGKDQDFLITY